MSAAEQASDAGDPLHPRRTPDLVGHDAAERRILSAIAGGRLPHAWLIAGPRGVGKSTLAYRFARRLLLGERHSGGLLDADSFGAQDDSLDLPADDPLFQRVAAGGHGNLLTIERGVDPVRRVMRSEIVVDDVRKLQGFFGRTGAEGGWRVCIVDSADEMNRNAANALLKTLEEPPKDSALILVSHAPGRLLPTIRSRCRMLRLTPLRDDEVRAVLMARMPDLESGEAERLAVLARGAPGRAIALAEAGGLTLYRRIVGHLARMPGLDLPALYDLAEELGGRGGDTSFRLFCDLLSDCLSRFVRAAGGNESGRAVMEEEAAIHTRFAAALPLDHWVELWEKAGRLGARADALHLDRKQALIAMFSLIDAAARGQPPSRADGI